MNTTEAWRKLIDKYHIIEEINKNGIFHIDASQIREFKEPRLMAKWDSSEQLPAPLKEKNINILPDSRKSYVLGDFLLYEDIPELDDHINQITSIRVPHYESIDIDNISSEATAINILVLSKILDDFLSTDENVATFNGRMGTGSFEFTVYDHNKEKKHHIDVFNAQCEIDGGFENKNSVVILEAKNVLHKDFHIRQLYYPYRLWRSKVKKPIRLVFSIYSNRIFRLFEYKFENIKDYSSIKLVQSKNYSLEDTKITLDDLINVKNKTIIKYNDNQDDKTLPPFVQADNFNRVISLLENMYDTTMDDEEIAELMHFGYYLNNGNPQYRQSQYYYNAGKYLGLFNKKKDNKKVVCYLTELGNEVYRMPYKERQLKLVSLILEHQIFSELFEYVLKNKTLPKKDVIMNKMRKLNVCGESQISRRASSVNSWLYWIFKLVKL